MKYIIIGLMTHYAQVTSHLAPTSHTTTVKALSTAATATVVDLQT